jgi:hypothetical protein
LVLFYHFYIYSHNIKVLNGMVSSEISLIDFTL